MELICPNESVLRCKQVCVRGGISQSDVGQISSGLTESDVLPRNVGFHEDFESPQDRQQLLKDL